MDFSTDMKTECVLWLIVEKSPTKVQRKFLLKYGKNAKLPSTKSIRRWHSLFKETGSVSPKKRNRKSTVNAAAVIDSIESNPKLSVRRLGNQCNISRESVRKILKKNDYHPYKPQIVQELHAADYGHRIKFAEEMQKNMEHHFLKLLLFSDEAIFHLDGALNRQNCRNWSTENPNWKIEKALNSPKTMVWAAIGSAGIIGPFFFDGNVSGDSYLQMLQTKFWPAFKRLQNCSKLIFMQDGAPPHYAKNVRDWLNKKFKNRWIGRGSDEDSRVLAWPPRSPDLTPCDFFMWGYVKSIVYHKNYKTIEELQDSILAAFQKISPSMITATLRNFEKKIEEVILKEGGHIE